MGGGLHHPLLLLLLLLVPLSASQVHNVSLTSYSSHTEMIWVGTFVRNCLNFFKFLTDLENQAPDLVSTYSLGKSVQVFRTRREHPLCSCRPGPSNRRPPSFCRGQDAAAAAPDGEVRGQHARQRARWQAGPHRSRRVPRPQLWCG